ncbi:MULTISPECIES: cold shock domain-containing protein [unclassified Streptomyces]|uniref:cold-shock protein n=1 Tax=unclassified Streptomyces TaxID=2593676 RepID=UPI0022B72698|nr:MULTISPECIES: cold shock domain-containing protein [unclassified Streptomyces]MCZ7417129.1 cold shock domain-containing protein [Streptomyces sp. WMMC897]MCZ7417895.1 cold shock domain-containing protein [Streptomyces sp. WMMC897]MCZ7417906.1 cold shock domain-containing protein [Streptomyces sp. WMMC897]MCZ7433043.1 cold shock domain-containing protein [Streptomyces sp. WMMC1477]
MSLGRVVRFDDVRGYGFIVPDEGGEDIFMHANDLQDEKHLYKPGTVVEFRLGHGDRGPKASMVSIVESDGGPRSAVGQPASDRVAQAAYAAEADDDVMCDVLSPTEFRQELTEALLDAAPTLTGGQILAVRQRMERLARAHGWLTA